MHWEKYIELTFVSKVDLHCVTDKIHIGMPMPMPMPIPMPSFQNGLFKNYIHCSILNYL